MFNNIFANGDDNAFKNFVARQKENIDKAIQHKQMIESRYFNPDSPFADAQAYSDNLMMMKRRVPMVIEYFKHKPTSPTDDYIESVEMYINPQRLSISTQKVKGKAYTRGGIFYHHWGDDHLTMQLSGTVGLSGMKGIEQLEKIYYHSGALLRYQNLGPDKIAQYEGNYKDVNYNDPMGVLNYLVNNDLASDNQKVLLQLMEQSRENQPLASQKKIFDIVRYIVDGYFNSLHIQTKSNTYQNLQAKVNTYYNKYVSNHGNQAPSFENLYQYAQTLVNQEKAYKNLNNNTKVAIAFEIVKNYYSDKFTINDGKLLTSIGVKLDADTVYAKMRDLTTSQVRELARYISAVNDINENSKIDRDSAYEGWRDIADELMDEWRPRQVFIYFEDRVYIGHFDLFSYQRVAEHSLIQYDMRLTIFRQIITTTNNSDKKPPSAHTLTSYVKSVTTPPAPVQNNTPAPQKPKDMKTMPEFGKFEIYHLRSDFSIKLMAQRNFSNRTVSDSQKNTLKDSVNDSRKLAGSLVTGISKNDSQYDLYNGDPTKELSRNQLLSFYAYGKLSTKDITDTTQKELIQYEIDAARDAAADEIALWKDIWDKEVKSGDIYKDGRKDEILDHVKEIREKSGYNGNRWEDAPSVKDLKRIFHVGDKVKIKQSATVYATGEKIPQWVKDMSSHTIMQVGSEKVLLKEIYSWVLSKDVQ